jgi:superfamily II DNA/RNA helicase
MKQVHSWQQRQPSKINFKSQAAAAQIDGSAQTAADLTLLSLHGKMAQKRREKTYEQFVAAPTAVLLCTDVAGVRRFSRHAPPSYSSLQPGASTSAMLTGLYSSMLRRTPIFLFTGDSPARHIAKPRPVTVSSAGLAALLEWVGVVAGED